MARHLVTGASGFIGSNLVARLKDQGEWVRAVDIKETPERRHLYEQADQVWVACDLRREQQAFNATRDMDWIWHLAADHGGAGYFYSDADFKAATNNLAIDRNVMCGAIDNEAERLFFASSACTYPVWIQGEGARPLKETDLGKGEGEQLYGMAKRMSTLLFEGAREHGYDFRSGIFHTIYGPTQDTEEPRAKFPTAICRKILEDAEWVEIWGDGSQVRTFLYIDDALDKIQTVMEAPYSGPVNVGSDEEVTVQQCAEWVAHAAGATPEWVYTTGPTGVAHRSSDNAVWIERYGEGELTTARDGFVKLFHWMADRAD